MIPRIMFALMLITLGLLIDLSLGVIKYFGFWSAFSINPLDYLVASDLLRGSAVPWLCSIGFGLFLRATILLPERAKGAPPPALKLVRNNHLRKLIAIALLAIPFLLYSIIILKLPNHGMLTRSPFFFAFLLFLFFQIWAVATPVNISKAIAITLATYAMIAVTEGKIARKKACDRVQAGEIQYRASQTDTTQLSKIGNDFVYLGSLRDFAFNYELQSQAIAVYEPGSDRLLSRSENVIPKCPQYLK